MFSARLGWILRPSPCCWNANALSSGHLRAGPQEHLKPELLELSSALLGACNLVSKRREGKKVEGGEKTSFTNCSQLCPSSSHFSCQELQAQALPNRLQSNRNPSQGQGLSIHPHRALHRDFNNYTSTLPLSARAAIMFFITAEAASTQGR